MPLDLVHFFYYSLYMTNFCITIEGPQGTGKTTLANYLRENLLSVNLYRLTGMPDKSINAKQKSLKMYKDLINYIKTVLNADISLVFDRIFFSELVYARIGLKEYDYENPFKILMNKYLKLNCKHIAIFLYLENTDLYIERLQRIRNAEYVKFDINNSINQQVEYLKLADELKKFTDIEVIKLPMDNFEKAYKIINERFNIK